MRFPLALSILVAAFGMACGEPSAPKSPQKESGVPANSLSDAKLHGEETPEDTAAREPSPDPTQPYITKVGEAPLPSEPEPKPKGGGTGAVSRSECDRVMDRYLQLEIAQNPRLAGVPPEVIEQAKQMARDQHGEAPCTATRAQYNCAMAATSTAAWQKCMK